MIGRNSEEQIQVFGDGYVRDLRELIENANGEDGLPLGFAGSNYAGNSDHDPFYREGVPFMFFFSAFRSRPRNSFHSVMTIAASAPSLA